jgi:vibriolysin
MPIKVQLFTATGALAQHPQAQLTVPAGYKIIGGGALSNWSGAGNLLTASYPATATRWMAAAKDHEIISPASLTVFAYAIHDPANEWDVAIHTAKAAPAPHPKVAATLPAGYVLTGGGGQVHYTGAGNFLTASFPVANSGWEARGKDHAIADPAAITAYAIGIRHRTGAIPVTGTVVAVTEQDLASHPLSWASLDLGWTPSGGGALTTSHGAGNLLTGSFPVGLSWAAAAKDHVHASGATMTAFVLGIREG